MRAKPKEKKTTIGKRIRVFVGDKVPDKDEDVKVLGEDTTLIVSSEEAKDKEIIGEQILVQIGNFDSVLRLINEREDLDSQTKGELKARVRELEKELGKKRPDRNRVNRLIEKFKDYSWLMPVITDMIQVILRQRT